MLRVLINNPGYRVADVPVKTGSPGLLPVQTGSCSSKHLSLMTAESDSFVVFLPVLTVTPTWYSRGKGLATGNHIKSGIREII